MRSPNPSRRRDLHFLNEDGMVACNPRDREAAHRAEMAGIATENADAVTCKKCRDVIRRTRGGRLDEAGLLYVTDRAEWRDWLARHYRSEKEIWLVYYRKHTGKPRIPYNDAVEEALCFGWIDSIVRGIDEDRFAQRFSVRKPNSPYSQANKERLRALIQQGRVAADVLPAVEHLVTEQFEIPPDILAAIQASPAARRNLEGFSPSYVHIRIAFIDGARGRPEEFKKRLRYFIRMTEKNKQFGFGGIEKYY